MAHRLVAHGIGGRTVEELNETMTVDEFLRWMAYATIEPLEHIRADWRHALAMAQNYNMHRGQGRPSKSPDKFLPQFHKARREMTVEQLEMALMTQFLALGGKLPPEALS